MGFIKCNGCFQGSRDKVGSLNELKYYSVSSNSEECGKSFYCCISCYRDRVFLDHVMDVAVHRGVYPVFRSVSAAQAQNDSGLVEILNEFSERYDEITEPSINHYSVDKYQARVDAMKKERTQTVPKGKTVVK